MKASDLPLAVIGAGSVGLAAAAHLHEPAIPFVLFELGDDVAAWQVVDNGAVSDLVMVSDAADACCH